MANGDVNGGAPSDYRPGDMRDGEWARLEPLIRRASPGGRPRKTDMRAAYERHSICCAPAARGATCPATAFRHARRSTTSSASSSVIASGGRSGRSCTWRYASGWPGGPALRLRFSTANRSNRRKRGRQRQPSALRRGQEREGPQKSTLCRYRRAADAGSLSTPPLSRTAMGPGWSSTRYVGASPGSN